MARAVVWNLYADPRGYTKGFREAEQTTRRFSTSVKKTAGLIGGAFAGIQVAGFLKDAIGEAREAAKVGRQTAAVIKATGGVARVSAKDVDRLASSLSAKAGVDDEVIASGANMLLTFKNVGNSAGKNNDIFNQATTVALDMAAAFNQGVVTQGNLEQANVRLGKALNDPIAGISALTRVGVTFTDAQKEQIKALVESGKTMEAQKIILGELKSEFGGAAEAAADPFTKLNVTVGNLKETLGTALVPALTDAAEAVDKAVTKFNDLNEETDGMAAKAVLAAAGLGVLVYGVVKVTSAFKALNETLGLSGAKLIQFGAYGAAAGEALNVITFNLNEFKNKGLEKGRFLDPASLAIKQVGDLFGVWGDKTKEQTDAQKVNTDAAKAGKEAAEAYGTAVGAAASAQGDAAAQAQELTGKLQGLKDQFKAQKQAVQDSIEAYDGLISKSDVTASEVIGDLKNQVANFKTYSADTQRLIKAGVDPKAIQELSQKGPQYIHALATGSASQLATYKETWKARNREVKGDFADAMSKQLADLKEKIRKMQAEIDKLHGKTVTITAQGVWVPPKGLGSIHSIVGATGGYVTPAAIMPRRLHGGGPLNGPGTETSDSIPAWLSKGEYVVNAKAVRMVGRNTMDWINAQGFAAGGPAGAEAGFGGKIQRSIDRLAAAIDRLTVKVPIQAANIPHAPGAWKLAMSFLHSLGIPARNISDFRAGARTHASGRASYHSFNRAVDIVGPNMLAIWQALTRTNPTELIYSRAPYYKSSRGWRPIGALDPITRADHYSHVHAAYDKGGWLGPGWTMAYNGTGRPERVLPPGQGGAISITVNVNGAVGSPREVARSLASELRAQIRDTQRRAGIPAGQQLR